MKWIQAIQQKLPKHKYAINAELLGDRAECAWSNLGYWDEVTKSYPQACMQLAEHLALAVGLNAHDRVIDLGCGQGASLKYWLDHYQIQNVEAVELQKQCVAQIKKKLPQIKNIHHQSFLNLKAVPFSEFFDVVFCIDAAYHSDLRIFLESVTTVLNPKARLGFHYLIWSEDELNSKQKLKYQCLLKAADVNINHLNTQIQTEQIIRAYGFDHIEIFDLSEKVLKGFSEYVTARLKAKYGGFDLLKIQMTAKLCRTLFNEGRVKYVQISAIKN